MIDWFLWIDPWGFPVPNIHQDQPIYGGVRKVQYPVFENQNGQNEPEMTSSIPYSDASEYPWLFDPNYRPPDRGEPEYDRTQDLPEQDRYQNPYDEPEFRPPPEYPFHDHNYGP